MLQVPRDIQVAYDQTIQEALVRREGDPDYRKWLRFYLDFCSKYGHPPDSKGSLPRFFSKLASKNQSTERQAQAARSLGVITMIWLQGSRQSRNCGAGSPECGRSLR